MKFGRGRAAVIGYDFPGVHFRASGKKAGGRIEAESQKTSCSFERAPRGVTSLALRGERRILISNLHFPMVTEMKVFYCVTQGNKRYEDKSIIYYRFCDRLMERMRFADAQIGPPVADPSSRCRQSRTRSPNNIKHTFGSRT